MHKKRKITEGTAKRQFISHEKKNTKTQSIHDARRALKERGSCALLISFIGGYKFGWFVYMCWHTREQ